MTSNYKLSNQAYTEHFDLTHPQVHTLRDAVNKNYKAGGGFGYICIPKPTTNGVPHSNFDEPTSIECRPAFVSANLVTRPNNNKDNQAHNAHKFEDEEYFLFTGTDTDAIASATTWKGNVSL
jgi:hypothetical protein